MISRLPTPRALLLVACSLSCGPVVAEDIVEVAESAGSFETLLSAASAAGLVETLKGGGPFTVFAPTDAAFAALPEGTVATLLEPGNADRLENLLGRHVVRGELPSEAMVGLWSAKTLAGNVLVITSDEGTLIVDGVEVVQPDVAADNGLIHVIGEVLVP